MIVRGGSICPAFFREVSLLILGNSDAFFSVILVYHKSIWKRGVPDRFPRRLKCPDAGLCRLCHVPGNQWGAKRCMNMEHLHEMDVQEESDYIAGQLPFTERLKLIWRKIFDTIFPVDLLPMPIKIYWYCVCCRMAALLFAEFC